MMAIVQAMCTSFKQEILLGTHAFGSTYRAADTFYIALYTSLATLSNTTTEYSDLEEVVNLDYIAGGQELVISVPPTGDTVANAAYVNFDPATWSAALTARGALIYNQTQDNKAVVVLDFGADKTSVSEFTITFPTYSSGGITAVIQIN